jgi:hypothetical protein
VVGEIEGGSGIRGRRIRERGELGEGDLLFLGGKKIWWKERRSGSEQFGLMTLTGTQLLLGILSSRSRKPQVFLELGI